MVQKPLAAMPVQLIRLPEVLPVTLYVVYPRSKIALCVSVDTGTQLVLVQSKPVSVIAPSNVGVVVNATAVV